MADAPTLAGDEAAAIARIRRRAQRKRLFFLLAAAVLGIALLVFVYEWLIGSRTVSTDNAYVGGDVAVVTPLISGAVAEVTVGDTDRARKGQLLVRLSDADAASELARAEAEYALARRNFQRTLATGKGLAAVIGARSAEIGSARAAYAAARSAHAKARVDYDRRNALVRSGAVSGDELTASTNALAAAAADVTRARAAVVQAEANRSTATEDYNANLALTRAATVDTSPEVGAARARLAAARLNMARTLIRAPTDGIVTRRQVQVGQRVAPGATLMSIVPVDQLYVDANFKESQLARVRPGQKAELTSTLYGGDVVYHGVVLGLSGGTGAAFALIPAQNATGNWIKITQRVPVRIRLDPRELREHPLRIGLSMDAEIKVTD